MDIVAVTRPDYFEGEAELINRLLGQGMKTLHIRKPEPDVSRFRNLMQGINPVYYNRVAVHQHHELAADFSLQRLHYTEQQRRLTPVEELKEKHEAGFILSSSIHELETLSGLQFMDYVFFGPVFNSISKPGYNSKLPVGFSLPFRSGGPSVIAIGGITPDRIAEVSRMNFDGAALLGALWP
jgi:thiamine-phosphate pyrophosphorylase